MPEPLPESASALVRPHDSTEKQNAKGVHLCDLLLTDEAKDVLRVTAGSSPTSPWRPGLPGERERSHVRRRTHRGSSWHVLATVACKAPRDWSSKLAGAANIVASSPKKAPFLSWVSTTSVQSSTTGPSFGAFRLTTPPRDHSTACRHRTRPSR